MNEILIEMKNVSKKFKSKIVLNNLDFSIPKGSIMGLLGKNGAGKTTLIKCSLGLLKCGSGQILIHNEDSWDLSEETKDRLGYVPQTSSFYPWQKVGDVIDYTASFYSKWNKEMVEPLLKDWELDRKDRAITLSEGQAQRLSIILALGHEPDLLILDEPVASLDPAARRRFLKAIIEILSTRECTILFSSHITSDLERVADRVAILDKGKIKLNCELGQLKDEVKCLKLIFHGDSPENLDFPGLLRYKKEEDKAIVYLKDFSLDKKRQIEEKFNAAAQIGDLNLEEIFVEMTR